MAAIPQHSNSPSNRSLVSVDRRGVEERGAGNRLGLDSKRQATPNKNSPGTNDTKKQMEIHLRKMGYSDDTINRIFETESLVRTRLLNHLEAYHSQTLVAIKEFVEFIDSQKKEIENLRSKTSTSVKILEILLDFALNKGIEKLEENLNKFLEEINVKRYVDASSDVIDYLKTGASVYKAANPKVEGKNLIEKIQSFKDNFINEGEDAFAFSYNKQRKEINSKNLITKIFSIYNQRIDQREIINHFIRRHEEDIVFICKLLDMPDITEVSLFYEVYLNLVTKFMVWLELEANEEMRQRMQSSAAGAELLYGGSNIWTRSRQLIEQNAKRRAKDIADKKAAIRGEAGF